MKLTLIKPSELKKEVPNNNFYYIKAPKQMAIDIIKQSGLNSQLTWTGKDRVVTLNLPDIKNKELHREFNSHPTVKLLIQIALEIGITRVQNQYEKAKRLQEMKLQAETIAEYENVVTEMDEVIEQQIATINKKDLEIQNLRALLAHKQTKDKEMQTYKQTFVRGL